MEIENLLFYNKQTMLIFQSMLLIKQITIKFYKMC